MTDEGTYPEGPGHRPASRRIASPDIVYRDSWTCSSCGASESMVSEGRTWTIRSPSDIADRLLVRLGQLEREELWVLTMNTKLRVLDERCLYRGNVSSAQVRIGELFTEAIRRNAAAIAIIHNHPSSEPTPSPDDLHLTAEAIAAGRLLDIRVVDHVILGGGSSYVSLRDRGIQFERPVRQDPR